MLVSDLSWWVGRQAYGPNHDAKAAKRVVSGDLLSGDSDSTLHRVERQTQVMAVLIQTQRAVAMRKFADLIVPYIAIGRTDATV